MYKLVFLLVFSAKALMASESKLHVTVDIYFKPTTTKPPGATIQFDIKPAGTIQVSEGQDIQFYAQTTTTLYDIWCDNANGDKILRPTVECISCDGTKKTWKLGGPLKYTKANINNMLNCVCQIKEPSDMKVIAPRTKGEDQKKYIQGEFKLQFLMTETPKVSLNIEQLNEYYWINEKQGRKKSNVTFTDEEEIRYDCSLSNPTENNENYKIIFYLDSKLVNSTEVSLKPHSNGTLSYNFKINKADHAIVCTAVDQGTYKGAPNPRIEINLQYIPPPSIFLDITDETKKLVKGRYLPKTQEQEYDYYFKAGEEVKITCTVNAAPGYELYTNDYGVDLQIDSKQMYTETVPYISRTLRLEKNDNALRCTSRNRKGASIPGVPHNLKSIVHLYLEPDPPELTIRGLTNLKKGEFIAESSMQMYHYNFTDGDFPKVSCNAKGNETLNLAFYFDGIHVNTWKGVTFIDHSFNLNYYNKNISCWAFDKETGNHLVTHVIELHYRAPDFTIRGLQNLRKGQFFVENSTQMYDYDFTNDETIKILCDTHKTEKTYNLAFYLDKTLKRQLRDMTSINQEFKLSKDNRQISCIVSDKTSGRVVETHIVRLHYNSPFEQIVSAKIELSVTGLADNSCVTNDKFNLEKTCNYTYSDPSLVGTTIPLQCTLAGKLRHTYTVTFGTYIKKVQDIDTQRTISKEISLTGKNDTVVCQATRSGGNSGGFNFSVEVHIYYIPPPPPTTEPSTTSTEKLTTYTQVETTTVGQNADAASSPAKEPPNWWLKFVLGGGAVFITVCVVCCFVYYRRKKPPPEDSTYANLAKDQNSYQTLPVAAPRTLKPGEKDPKVTVNGTYSEPKDSQDMSEALYADPNRFNGSETYAEPYVKSATKLKNESDYAEPYLQKSDGGYAEIVKPEGNYAAIGNSEGNYAAIGNSEGNYAAIGNSEGNYAVIGKNSDNKELYAKPIPKSQRPVKKKDESNYSNVFTEQYANTKQ